MKSDEFFTSGQGSIPMRALPGAMGALEVVVECVVPPIVVFNTPGSCGRNLQDTQCVLGGKSRVKAVTLFLTPPFRLNS